MQALEQSLFFFGLFLSFFVTLPLIWLHRNLSCYFGRLLFLYPLLYGFGCAVFYQTQIIIFAKHCDRISCVYVKWLCFSPTFVNSMGAE